MQEISNATIGSGRRIRPEPDAERLGWTPEQKTQVVNDMKSFFREASNSKRKWIDQEGDQTLGEMQRMVLESAIAVGESYTLAFMFEDDLRPFRASFAVIDEDRIRTPQQEIFRDDPLIMAGHRKGPSGRASSYFVHDYHRNDPRAGMNEAYTEVRRFNEFGREQVIHSYIKRQPGLSRGLSHMSAAFDKMRCLEKYDKVRMEAAILQTAMAFVVKSNDRNVISDILSNPNIDPEVAESQLKKLYAYSMQKAVQSQELLNDSPLKVDGAKFFRLMENEEAQILTGSEANLDDKTFVDGCLQVIARATGGHSRATLTQDFEASFSAARAALISFYRQCEMHGHFIVDDWLQSVWSVLLEDAIQLGIIPIPNYPNPAEAWMHFVLNRELYCRATFIGPGRDEIDQAKSLAYWQGRKELNAFNLQGFHDSVGQDWQEEILQTFEEMKFIDAQIDACELKHIDPLQYLGLTADAVVPIPTQQPEEQEEEEIETQE